MAVEEDNNTTSSNSIIGDKKEDFLPALKDAWKTPNMEVSIRPDGH